MNVFIQRLLQSKGDCRSVTKSTLALMCVLVFGTTILRAQVVIPPIVSDSTWTYWATSSTESDVMIAPSFACAEDAQLIFFGTNSSNVIVLDAITGVRLDTIDVVDYDTAARPKIFKVYTNDAGTILEILWTTGPDKWLNASIVEYPSKLELNEVCR